MKEILKQLEQGLEQLQKQKEEVTAAVLRQEGAILLARQLLAQEEEAVQKPTEAEEPS